ncbi:MAG: bifunctional phosphoribosylaminoimidazolecarboxamide formyltransferase/IMP cyclohydrolase [Oligoflexia bacterium]|nr:bifunctional phosphoribosylaminoimidazolecarboxamide formyltransferase/IMP cyclohydrolase [Oligoflexia bacterium]
MFKRALVSTSNKTGLIEFIKPLVEQGCDIVSTGGTSKFLRDHGIKVLEVADVTGFPEMMDGRIRTLHPYIHMGLLARGFVPEDAKILKEHGVKPFDLVVVNLYPFEESYKKNLKGQELIEQIDIGGPSMLRAAAKSFERLTVVCDPSDYEVVLNQAKNGDSNIDFRQLLAAKVFEHCAYYDSLVAHALYEKPWDERDALTLGFRKKALLRYGENPHQKAGWYESPVQDRLSLSSAEQIQGKELSYNNILDLEAAVGAVSDFDEPCSVIIKHVTPCGVAVDDTIEKAFKKAFDADSISAFGGIVAINRTLTASLAKELVVPFLECVIAPDIEENAKPILAAKKNLRVLTLKNLSEKDNGSQRIEFKSIRGGMLVQSADQPCEYSEKWKIIGEKPTKQVLDDLIFAQKVVRHVKSNAIVIAKNRQTLGICGGQTNRVDSVKWALERSKGRGEKLVLGSDAFFPFRDSIDLAAKAGIAWIIQPGGSMRDAEVEAAAQEHKIGMLITGTRHFKH